MRKRAPQGSRRRERSYPYLAWREGKVAGPSDEVSISRGGSVSTCNEAGEEVENLTEGADVHWLNSLGGTACLLVDSYRDLGDGIAVEEAFSLVQAWQRPLRTAITPIIVSRTSFPLRSFTLSRPSYQYSRCQDRGPTPPETNPTERVRRALADLVVARGRSNVPPRLLQEEFPRNVCRGDPTACGDLVAFLKRLHDADRKRHSNDPARALSTKRRLPNNGQSCRRVPRGRKEQTSPSSASSQHRRGATTASAAHDAGTATSAANGHFQDDYTAPAGTQPERVGRAAAAGTERSPRSIAACTRSFRLRGYGCTKTSPSFAPRTRIGGAKQRPQTGRRASAAAVIREDASSNRRRSDTHGVRPVGAMGSSVNREVALQTTKENMVDKNVGSCRHRERAAVDCDKGAKAAGGVIGHVGGTLGTVRGSSVTAARSTRTSGTAILVPRQASRNRGGRQSVPSDGDVGAAMTAVGARESRSSRKDILRWMDRLGLKVDWSVLTPEDAPCHESLSNGLLLCELAAAIDYVASGGRGLPLSEIPSCPGRFVLRGTCSTPPNAARSRHNVRTALGAFDSLGGVSGVWLHDEQAILDGDYKMTWGLLGAVYARYGRLCRRYIRKHRVLSPPHKAVLPGNITPTSKRPSVGPAEYKPTKAIPHGGGHSTKEARCVGRQPSEIKKSAVADAATNRPRGPCWPGPARPCARSDAVYLSGKPVRMTRIGKAKKRVVRTAERAEDIPPGVQTDLRVGFSVPASVSTDATPGFTAADGESSPGARENNIHSSPPRAQKPYRESSGMCPCGKITRRSRLVVGTRSVPKVGRLEEERQQQTRKSIDERLDSPREDANARRALASENINIVPVCQAGANFFFNTRQALKGWCQQAARVDEYSASCRQERLNPTYVAASRGGESLSGQEMHQSLRWDSAHESNNAHGWNRLQTRTDAVSMLHQANGTIPPDAGQFRHADSAVGGCPTTPKPIPTSKAEGITIVVHGDSPRIPPSPPNPPPQTTKPLVTVVRTNIASIAPRETSSGTTEEKEDIARSQNAGENKASRSAYIRRECRRQREELSQTIFDSPATTGTSRSRWVSFDDSSFSTTPALKGPSTRTDCCPLSLGGLPPSSGFQSPNAMPQDPFSRGAGLDLLPLSHHGVGYAQVAST